MTLSYFVGDELHNETFDYKLEDITDFISDYKEEIINALVDDLLDFNFLERWELPQDEEELRKLLLEDKALLKELCSEFEYDLLDWFEDDIKEYYYDDAMEAYQETKEYASDPYSYNGVSRKWFF